MEKRKFKAYKCFSNRQKEWLMNKGFEYITIAKDPKSDALFWLFLRSQEFNEALDKYDLTMKCK